jgi:hypothetical protein
VNASGSEGTVRVFVAMKMGHKRRLEGEIIVQKLESGSDNTKQWLCLSGSYTHSKGKNNLVGAGE